MKIRRHLATLWIALIVAAMAVPQAANAQTKLLRYPDIHGERVVFSYAGDLWLAPASGGTATRLTSHPGREFFAKFSHDGRWIAFTGQYDGDEQVYVIPSGGGVPKQLTYYPARGPLADRWGFDNQVYGWTRDGRVLYRSLRDGWDLTDSRLYTISLDGGLPEPLPMPISGAGALSPDETRVVYSPLFRDFRTWKRYQGGWAQDLYIFNLETLEATPVTDHPRADRDPMWVGEEIYFASDRDGTNNLYAYEVASGETRQITESETWDVRWPSADDRRVVYELNGELEVYDSRDGSVTQLSITVPNDGVAMRPSRVSAAGNIEGFALSPRGERALFVARGDVFTAPIEKGPTRNLTNSSSAHDKRAEWSPDGTRIAFISDRSGEEQLHVVSQDGSGELRQLTDHGVGMSYTPRWSPDGAHIAFSDKEGRIHVVAVQSGEIRQVAEERQGQVFDYTWSPDSRYLAFSLNDPNGFASIYIWDLAENRLDRVTGPMFNEFQPAWDPAGDYLFYIADRSFAPQIGSFEWNYVVDRESGIYALALRNDVPNPFPPQSDEVKTDGKADEEAGDGEGDEEVGDRSGPKTAVPPIRIDFEGLAERVARVPIEYDNYSNLATVDGHLLYRRTSPFYYGRPAGVEPALKLFSLEDREETTLAEDADGYALSVDGKKALVRSGQSYKLYDVKAKGGESKAVSTQGLMVDRVPAEEWAQIFDEVWRRFRDWFYVENMHGYDWEALGEQYRALLPHVAHRSDLNYLIGEMVAELSVSHAYIAGGDFEAPDRPEVALPGARFELDEASGRYRVSMIFEGQNEEDRYRSPLTEIGVDVRIGDYVLAIDGVELVGPDNPYRLLLHKADRPVTLTVNDRPTADGSREVSFNPIDSEIPVKYLAWAEKNRRYVDEATGGQVGYLHLPDMGSNGIREFIKWYYGQIRKGGLIIDVRGNGGGNVSQMLIERLRREILRVRFVRTNEWPLTYPSSVFYGHLVTILNETSASDGDIFPAMFKRAGLGPLIGKRSWGGVIGITGHGPLIDGGSVFVPQFGTNDLDGSWIIEGHGVDPDIIVENTPKSVIEGRDLQLERAIEEITGMIERDPKRFPPRPAPPVRTKAAGG
jgi:tricorn protease